MRRRRRLGTPETRRRRVFGPREWATGYANTPKRERGRRMSSPSLGTGGACRGRGSPARSSGDGRSEVVARSKTCCSCVLDPRADSGRHCEGDPEIREAQGSLRSEKFGGARTHRRRCTGQSLVLQGWGRATVGSEVFLASGRSSCGGFRGLGSGRAAASRRRRGPVRRSRVRRGVLGFGVAAGWNEVQGESRDAKIEAGR